LSFHKLLQASSPLVADIQSGFNATPHHGGVGGGKKARRKDVLLRMKQLEHVVNDVHGTKVMRLMQKENDRRISIVIKEVKGPDRQEVKE
jgi:hypothetical protein